MRQPEKGAEGKETRARAKAAAVADEPSVDELMAKRLEKAQQMRDDGLEPFAYTYSNTHLATHAHALEKAQQMRDDGL